MEMAARGRRRGRACVILRPLRPRFSHLDCRSVLILIVALQREAAVYPRVYGESSPPPPPSRSPPGLSPRVRGILGTYGQVDRAVGSIPACTGNPDRAHSAPCGPGVYPRVYGESQSEYHAPWEIMGLSPRVRGIPLPILFESDDAGSIPACTGNPRESEILVELAWVYPRVYGESDEWTITAPNDRGLSPRVRGIRRRSERHALRNGSIPACTGNPVAATPLAATSRVYPRVYGESGSRGSAPATLGGLSPRVRGIRPDGQAGGARSGSIPACTGNPALLAQRNGRKKVYPRVYGESQYERYKTEMDGGLSPRVRGIPQAGREGIAIERSIPACTGNPHVQVRPAAPMRVYPRVYGESTATAPPPLTAGGLSPRVRGIRRRG